MRGALIALLVVAAAGFGPAAASAYTSPGNPTGHVNDFAQVLSSEAAASLNAELTAFNASTSNEIAVAIVPDMGGDYLENYAVKLFEEWGIGKAQRDNGVLLLLAIEEREIRIEVGYGLEGALPDSVAARIIDGMTPQLQEGDYDAAVTGAVRDIMAATQGEYVGESEQQGSFLGGLPLEAIIFLPFFVLTWLAAILGRSKSWWAGGVLGFVLGVIAWVFGGSPAWLWGLATAVLTGSGLLFDYIVSQSYAKAKRTGGTPPWWGGGTGFGGGRSGGGFGGFGGGSSGGGGASGRW